ncbi:MAG: metallophosphoesterase [Clostridia bacterium]|nr:metallophosphoesterase [Clostridia bacterium]
MKKRKIISICIAALLTVVSLFAFMPATEIAAASSVVESDFVSSGLGLVKGEDYDYSFAVVGDTQNLNYRDAKEGSKNMNKLYTWIKNNTEALNIKYVMGLGDITQSFNANQTYYDEEWANAKEALAILDDADIPYSLIRGNHDISSGLNATFGEGSEYYNDLLALAAEGKAGFYREGKIEETWRKVEVGSDKFLIITLDWFPTEGSMYWAENIINQNPDHRVIVTTHTFLASDGTFYDDPDGTFPYEQEASSNTDWIGAAGGNVSPRTLWEEVLSQYANVEMILCGHVDVDDIETTQLRGVNGNTVTCMLIDAQSVDIQRDDFEGNVGMVTMFYLKEGGEVVNVEHISAVRAMDNLTEGATQKNIYLKAKNQFTVKLEYEDGWTKTDYGYIPTEKYNAANNYFHMFVDDDGISTNDSVYLGSFERWVNDSGTGGACVAAKQYYDLGGITVRRNKTLFVLMNKSYDGHGDETYQNIGNAPGGVVLDLGGNTYTVGNNPVWILYARNSDRAGAFSMVNGDVKLSGWNALVFTGSNASNGAEMNLNFRDLNVYYDEDGSGTSAKVIASTMAGYTTASSTLNITIDDCSFNLKDNAPDKAITAFSLAEANLNHHTKLTVNGGSFKGASSSVFTLFAGNDGSDSLTFGKGSDGNYTTLTLGDEATLSNIYKNDEGSYVKFGAATKVSDTEYTYSIEDATVTDTGFDISQVPDTKVFGNYDQSGVYKGSHPTWDGAFCTDNAANDRVLVLTIDYTAEKRKAAGAISGSITIDLNGKTLTAASNGLMNFYYTSSTTTDSLNITFKNGTINYSNTSTGLFQFQHADLGEQDAKSYNFTFEDVTFEGNNNMFTIWSSPTDQSGTRTTAIFNNCTFNYSDQIIFNVGSGDTNHKNLFNITVNGGKIITDTPLTQTMIFSANTTADYEDTFAIGKYNGKYPEIYLTSGTQAGGFTLVNGLTANAVKLPDTVTLEEIAYNVYPIGDVLTTVSTPYGIIPEAFKDEESYPFAVFKDGSFVNAYSDWATLLNALNAKLNADADTADVLLRRNFSIANPSFSNLSQLRGTATFDLGTYELKVETGNLFAANKKTAYNTTINVKNGDILLGGSSMLVYLGTSSNGSGMNFNFTFDEVDISYASGATGSTFINTMQLSEVAPSTANITFKNCNIDLVTNVTKAAVTLLNIANDANNNIANVVFDGGSIYANNNVVTFAKMNTSGAAIDSVKFSSDSGRYTKIIAPIGGEAVVFDYVTAAGSVATAAKWNDNETLGTTTYIVRESALTAFAPKTSITLGSTLIYNVYVPVCAELKSITLMGSKFDDLTLLDPYIKTLDDGKSYYEIPVKFIAECLADEFALEAELQVGTKTYSGKWTLSIPKYASTVLNSDASEIEKTLIKDVLVYIRSAYNYFAPEKDTVISNISSMLGDYTQGEFKMDEVNVNTSELAAATYSLGSLQSVWLWLPENADISEYSFKVGERVLDFTYDTYVSADELNGHIYVNVELYAYEILKTIDVYKNDVKCADYHISCYYNYAKGTGETDYNAEDKDALVALVESFYTYCNSAESYRNSVINSAD